MRKPTDGIFLQVEPGRFVHQSDGHWYVYLANEDFQQVPSETLAYWLQAEGQEIPVTVSTLPGTKSPVPPGEQVRIVMPSGSINDFAPGQMFFTARREQSLIYPDGHAAVRTRTVDARSLQPLGRKGDQQPVLSDDLLFHKQAHLPAVPRKMQDAINNALRTSRAFVFDRGASYRVGEICSYEPDLIADSQEFARVPFPKTWIELDAHALMQAMIDAGLNTSIDENLPRDDRLGFLYTERGIYTATSSEDRRAGWSPFAFRPHQPMTREQEARFTHEFGVSRMQIDQWFWGNAYDLLDPSRRRSLRSQHGFDIMLEPGWSGGEGGRLRPLLSGGGAGDLKVALCAALLLIRPNLLTTIETREPTRRMVHNKPTVFIAHRVVTVKLSPDRLVRRIRVACKEEAGRAKARWHEVRGHYCHNHRAKVSPCIHDWEEVSPDRWTCRKGCGGKRAWRQYPEGRGSAEVGVVTKHYQVKP